MISRRALAFGGAALVGCAGSVDAQQKRPPAPAAATSRKPKLPPGRDPGGVPVAVIGSGVDYTEPSIGARLARDGEGDLIGWDCIDNDNRPYSGDHRAAGLVNSIEGRVVPVRLSWHEPAMLHQALAFVSRTPARVALILDDRSLFDDRSIGSVRRIERALLAAHSEVLAIIPGDFVSEPALPSDTWLTTRLIGDDRLSSIQGQSDLIASKGPAHLGIIGSPSATAPANCSLASGVMLCWPPDTLAAVRLTAMAAKLMAASGGRLSSGELRSRLVALAQPANSPSDPALVHGVIPLDVEHATQR